MPQRRERRCSFNAASASFSITSRSQLPSAIRITLHDDAAVALFHGDRNKTLLEARTAQTSGQLVDTFHASSNTSNSSRVRQAGTPGNARAARAAASEASSFPRTEDGRTPVQPHAGTCASGLAWPDRG